MRDDTFFEVIYTQSPAYRLKLLSYFGLRLIFLTRLISCRFVAMDWPMQILLLLISISGLSKLCYCDSHSNLETAQRFEICVVNELSRSTLFSAREKSQMSRIVKETDIRMRRMGVDPTSASNVRTMLRLFSVALANLVFDDENPPKRCDRKQNYISSLKLCSSSLDESTATELISEVSIIFTSMENHKSIKNFNDEATMIPENKANLFDKLMASGESKTKKRQKRAPQFSEGFEFNPPLEPVIAGVLITSPVFGLTFKNGLTKQDATNYARSMVEAALKDYDYAVTREAMNAVTNEMSSLMFMLQTADYAFAISRSINKVLSACGLATFADGVGIGNALISKLQVMTETQNPMFPLPSTFSSPASSSGWESDIRITSQSKMGAPQVQINPSWDMPPPPQFQFDSGKQDFGPQLFTDTGSRYPLNPSFAPDPVAPLSGFGSGFSSVENPGVSSFSANIPFDQVTSFAASQSAWPPSPFPVEQTFGQETRFPNQPTATDKAIPFRFDLPGTQDFSSSSFVDQLPAQQSELFNQPASQYQQTFDFSSGDSRVSAQQPDIFDLPPIPKEDTNPFDKTFSQSEISEQTPIRKEIAYPSDDIKVTTRNQETSYQPKEDIPKFGDTPDLNIMDATSVIESNLDLSEEFASVFSGEISPNDAASFATAMAKFSLSQYDPTVAANVEAQVGNAVNSLPLNSSPADYARSIADSFIKAIHQNGLLNSINSKIIAYSLITGLKRELNNRRTRADSSTITQDTNSQNEKSDEMLIPLNGGETQAFSDVTMPSGSDGFAQETNQKVPKKEADVNTKVSSLEIDNVPQSEVSNSSQSSSNKDLTPNLSLEIPLEPRPFVSGSQPEQPKKEASNLNTTIATTTSPLEVTVSSIATSKLLSIADLLYSTFVTTETVPTTDPYVTTLAKAIKNPEELFGLLMDEVDSSLKALNQTTGFKRQQNIATTEQATTTNLTKTTKMDEFVPVTPPTTFLNSKSVDIKNNGQSSMDTKVELQPSFLPTPLPLQKTSKKPENSEIVTEKTEGSTQLDEASLFAERVTSIASSAIAYIRSGKLNLDELCGKLNVLAFVVEIPPVDNCTEIAMIDYLLNVLNAVVSNLRRN